MELYASAIRLWKRFHRKDLIWSLKSVALLRSPEIDSVQENSIPVPQFECSACTLETAKECPSCHRSSCGDNPSQSSVQHVSLSAREKGAFEPSFSEKGTVYRDGPDIVWLRNPSTGKEWTSLFPVQVTQALNEFVSIPLRSIIRLAVRSPG